MDEAKGSELLATLCDARSSSVHDRLVPLRCHVGVDRAGVGLKTSFLLAMPFVPTSFLLLIRMLLVTSCYVDGVECELMCTHRAPDLSPAQAELSTNVAIVSYSYGWVMSQKSLSAYPAVGAVPESTLERNLCCKESVQFQEK